MPGPLQKEGSSPHYTPTQPSPFSPDAQSGEDPCKNSKHETPPPVPPQNGGLLDHKRNRPGRLGGTRSDGRSHPGSVRASEAGRRRRGGVPLVNAPGDHNPICTPGSEMARPGRGEGRITASRRAPQQHPTSATPPEVAEMLPGRRDPMRPWRPPRRGPPGDHPREQLLRDNPRHPTAYRTFRPEMIRGSVRPSPGPYHHVQPECAFHPDYPAHVVRGQSEENPETGQGRG
jgi:hypothetical protein